LDRFSILSEQLYFQLPYVKIVIGDAAYKLRTAFNTNDAGIAIKPKGTARKGNKMNIKKSIMILTLCLAAAGMTACSGAGSANNTSDTSSIGDTSSTAAADANNNLPENVGDGSTLATEVQEGTLIAPDGEKVEFVGPMENDESGNIRLATTASAIPTGDYGFAYYKAYFKSDDEVHAVVNTNLGTTTSIRCKDGVLLIDTYAYVEGEEKDAALLFTGEAQGSYVLDAETGGETVYEE